MPCRIRIQRVGHKTSTIYKIIVCDAKKGRNTGAFVEKIGHYHPQDRNTHQEVLNREVEGHKLLLIDFERAKHWISQGAQPTKQVHRIFSLVGLLPPLPNVVPKGWQAQEWDQSFIDAAKYWTRVKKIEDKEEL
ncbi:ribosomal protein S16 [Acrasis kona]|uniref:Ribosomal protein S16 n=1 Tax=Acrasis kona TaxID=1008807 RepID=A0AAW2ZCW6_9EUKA